ncbi:MAG: hypothetical protein ACR2K4_03340 [Candidatus Limnocylindria bacterium]
MGTFAESERSAALERLLDQLREDDRIEAVVLTGSLGVDRLDAWSDLDLTAVVRSEVDCAVVASDWTRRVYDEWPVAHHYENAYETTLVRGFLLSSGLVLDLAFAPLEDFSVWAPVRVAFDRRDAVTRVAGSPEAWVPTPDWPGEAGYAWHDVLHACSAAVRRRPWRSLYYLQRVRNRALALAAERNGLDADEFKQVDNLPSEATAALVPTLVPDLASPSLMAAIDAATKAFLAELRHGDPDLAARLKPPLLAWVDASDAAIKRAGDSRTGTILSRGPG